MTKPLVQIARHRFLIAVRGGTAGIGETVPGMRYKRILATVGKPSDLVLSHPRYHDMIPYSGSEWGREGGPSWR